MSESKSLAEGGVALDLPFKGKRDYLHSTSFWDAITGILGKDEGAGPTNMQMSLRIRRLARHKVRLVPFGGKAQASVVGDLTVRDDSGGSKSVYVLEETTMPVVAREPDHEPAITDHVTIEDDTCCFAGPFVTTPIEAVVAATKALHLAAVDDQVKWLATRLSLPLGFAFAEGDVLKVRIKLRTDRMATVSTVHRNGTLLGEIGFNPAP